jgi:hypothetical protein
MLTGDFTRLLFRLVPLVFLCRSNLPHKLSTCYQQVIHKLSTHHIVVSLWFNPHFHIFSVLYYYYYNSYCLGVFCIVVCRAVA